MSEAEVKIVGETDDHIDISIPDAVFVAEGSSAPDGYITPGFWWARKRSDRTLTVIKVETRDWVEPDEDDYGVLWGTIMGRDYDDRLDDDSPFCVRRSYNFIARIPEPA